MHERAKAVATRLGPVAIVTTQMALAEALNHLSGKGRRLRELAVQMVGELQDNPDVEIVPQTDAQFKVAVERYAARSDQTWSLTDCASFLVMEERNISEALAYDRDFKQAGFVALLRDNRQ
jgi:predicted nucleic acid-binding protein